MPRSPMPPVPRIPSVYGRENVQSGYFPPAPAPAPPPPPPKAGVPRPGPGQVDERERGRARDAVPLAVAHPVVAPTLTPVPVPVMPPVPLSNGADARGPKRAPSGGKLRKSNSRSRVS